MAVKLPIISEFNSKGFDKAIKEFKQLENASAKANFAIKKAAIPAGIAVAALGGFLVHAAKGAEEARQANQRLGNVLDSMGFGQATERVSAFAESLEKTVAVDADVIKATQTVLATFGQLTKTANEVGGSFDRATLAALDMAAAGFGTAESNAVQLGKALENPIKGIAALAKSGVTFTDQEKEKIKVLVESNKMLEAQDMVLKAIEKQVGGTAEASASSFDKMKFSLAGISDTFGELVLPAIDKFAVVLAGVSVFVSENEKLVGILVITIGALAGAVLIANAALKVFAAAKLAVAAALFIATKAQAAFNLVMAANPIALVIIAIAAVVAAFIVLEKRFGLVSAAVRVIGNVFNKFLIQPIATAVSLIGKLISALGRIPGLRALGNVVGGALKGIPGLAAGGIVTRPTLAMIGEAGPEAVIPLNRMNSGGGITVNVMGGLATSAEIGQAVVNAIRAYNRSAGPANIQVA